MYGRIVKSERILAKLRVLDYEYICDRTTPHGRGVATRCHGPQWLQWDSPHLPPNCPFDFDDPN